MHRINLTDNRFYQIRLLTALASLCLSIFTLYGSNINNDGILYLRTTELYLQGKSAEFFIYNTWPFFSIIITYIHKITSLSVETIAYTMNALLFILLLDTLLLISKKILPNYRQVAITAILLLCFQALNEYREFIIRDFGYWAFFSLALYRFMVFIEKPNLINSTYWQLAATVAFLFRIEGIVVLLGLPMYLFILYTPKMAFIRYAQTNYLLIIATIPAILISRQILGIFKKVEDMYIGLSDWIPDFSDKVSLMATEILEPDYSAEYSTLVLSSGLIAMLVYKIIKALSFSYIGLFMFSFWQRQKPYPVPHQGLIRYLALLTLIPLILFVFLLFFVSTRYTMTALISLLLLMLPRLTQMIEEAWLSRNKLLLTIIGAVLLVHLVDGTTSSRAKPYIKEVAIWASSNLPKNSIVLTNNNIIEYYYQSRQKAAQITHDNNIEAIQKSYQRYNYLILLKKRNNTEIETKLKTMKLNKVHCQGKKRSGEVCVYKVLPD